MRLDRPYRKALSPEQIDAELRSEAGAKFDPRLVDLFLEMLHAERRAQAA
jgi:HD-GYP domain-containing protein (c-di-GMP phosphodiesterase class II)